MRMLHLRQQTFGLFVRTARSHYLHFNHGNCQIVMCNLQFYREFGWRIVRAAQPVYARTHAPAHRPRAAFGNAADCDFFPLFIPIFIGRNNIFGGHSHAAIFAINMATIDWITRHDPAPPNRNRTQIARRARPKRAKCAHDRADLFVRRHRVTQTYRTGTKQIAKWYLASSGQAAACAISTQKNAMESSTIVAANFYFYVLLVLLLCFRLFSDFARLPAQRNAAHVTAGHCFSRHGVVHGAFLVHIHRCTFPSLSPRE